MRAYENLVLGGLRKVDGSSWSGRPVHMAPEEVADVGPESVARIVILTDDLGGGPGIICFP